MRISKKAVIMIFTVALILILFTGVVTANASSSPTMTGFSPNGTTVRTPTCTMQATGVSNATGISSVFFAVYNQTDGGANYVGYSGTNMGGGTYQAAFNSANHITKTGTFIVNVFCIDNSNNQLFIKSYSFVVDTSPKMTGFSPNGSTIYTPTCTMQATGVSNPATGVNGVLFAVYNQADGGENYVGYYSTTNIGGGTYQATFDRSKHITKTGTFIVNVLCVDNSNNWLYMNSYSFVVQDSPPTITGFSPNGSTVYASTCTIQATGISDLNGVSSVLFAVYNQADGGINYVGYSGTNVGGGTYQATFNSSNHITKTGTFIVNVYCTDNLGNRVQMGTYSFVVSDASTLTGFSPNNTTIYTPTCTMTATGVKDLNGVRSVLFAVYNQTDGGVNYVGYSGTNMSGGTYQATFNRSNHITKTGTFLVNVFCEDNLGNVSFLNTYSFVVDNQGPTMTGFSPDGINVTTQTYTMQATGVNDPSGISSVLFAVWNETDTTAYYVGYPGVKTVDGTYQATFDRSRHITKTGLFHVNVWGIDNMGNRVLMNTYSFTVDTTQPVTSILSPSEYSFVNGTVIINGTVSDLTLSNWILEYGTGESPITWTALNSGTTSITNGSLGSWDTSALIDGVYTLRLRATDIAENSNQMTINVIKNINPPAMGWFTPSSNTYKNSSLPMTVNAVSDSVSSVLFSVYNEADGLNNYIDYPGINKGGGKWEAIFDSAKHSTKTGTFIVNILGQDNLGHYGLIGSSQFIVTGSNASIADQLDIHYENSSVVVTVFKVKDSLGVDSVEATVYCKDHSGNLISSQVVEFSRTSPESNDWSASFNPSTTDGNIDIELIVYDQSGIPTYLGLFNIVL